MPFNPEILKQHLDFCRPTQVLVAYSGGLDSHVLLHSIASLRRLHPQLEMRAIHINHGLSPKAQDWAEHCRQVCQALNITFLVKSVDVRQHLANWSLEEAARNLRYEALASEMRVGEYLLLAHTEDDQAETLLLQLLRGSGVRGLAAMPLAKPFATGSLIRPLLHISRKALQHYAIQHQLTWVEDESNLLLTLDRNYLRHQVLPPLATRWPQVKKVLSRVAKHCAEAVELVEELAAVDLSQAGGELPHTLSVAALVKLSPARQKNVLRFWLKSLQLPVPNASRLAQLQQDFLYSKEHRTPKMTWSGVEIRRFNDSLYAMPALPAHDAKIVFSWDMTQPLVIPGLGILTAKPGEEGVEILAGAEVTVRFRQGGERFHPLGRSGSHPLKKLFQEWRIPPWQRDRLPLIYFDEDLAVVPNHAVAKKYAASGHRRGLVMLVEFNPGV
ncbi:MAG TPA: tRNA lysidine(34) synthetase TilS [Gammaproteobacteria bacterium]|nr:tRNA lysidine(34) synthetase TilS [Gammaproteobacteria bacterium]